ncbi:MAG: hypothetical protein ACK6DC_01490 [Planctomycetota bacterium]|jgi:hypothetical protein
MMHGSPIIAMLGWCTLLIASNAPLASESEPGRKAVRRGTSTIWAEPENESVTVPENQLDRGDYSDRHESILSDAGDSAWNRWLRDFWDLGNGSSSLAAFSKWMYEAWRLLVLIGLGILVAVLVYFLLRSEAFRTFFSPRSEDRTTEDLEQQRAKVSDLPFEIEQPLVGLRAQAERLRNAGDYSKAIVYLFSYLLVELDHAHCIRLERGKTNGAYVRELHPWSSLLSTMLPTVRLFELAYFGRREIDRDAFEGVWSKLASFEEMLAQIRGGKWPRDLASPIPSTSATQASQVGVAP